MEVFLLALLLLLGCTPASSDDDGSTPDTTSETTPSEGSLRALIYNVAGLPEPLSSSEPEENHPVISPMLNDWELVLVQEDFSYHHLLEADAEHPHQSVPLEPSEEVISDGLNRFSNFPFEDLDRQRWDVCNGVIDSSSDCLAEKGFSVATHELAEGVFLRVVNLHADAGSGPDDIAARASNFAQVAAWFDANDDGTAVLLGGDTNLKTTGERPEDEPIWSDLLSDVGLTDVCDATDCIEPGRIDKWAFRSSDELELLIDRRWEVEEFTIDGEPLSDHDAIGLELTWKSN